MAPKKVIIDTDPGIGTYSIAEHVWTRCTVLVSCYFYPQWAHQSVYFEALFV